MMVEGELITISVRLKEPGDAPGGAIKSFEVPYRKDMRIIDALHWLSDQGHSFAYRWFCSTKKCGACAMKVNGEPKLVCWEAIEEKVNLIEPLDNYEVIRDLVVDREASQARYLKMKPYLDRKETPPWPEPLTHKQMLGPYKLMDCIECGICTSVCPAYTGVSGLFPGPWASVQAAKFARDPRDELDRRDVLENFGVDNCMSCYRCEQVCPLGIPIVDEAIEPLRGIAARGPSGRASFPIAFAENIRKNVFIHSASLFVGTRSIGETITSLPMAMQMFTRGKTKLVAKTNQHAMRSIQAMFKEAGQEEVK